MKLFQHVVVATFLGCAVCAVAQNEGARILREDLAGRDGSAIVLSPEPETARIISPAAVVYDVGEKFSEDTRGGVVVRASGAAAAELELVGIYKGPTSFVLPRREMPKEEGVVRWTLPNLDQLTSFTLALRGTNATRIMDARVEDFSSLSLREQLLAATDQPLSVVSATNRGADGRLAVLLNVPDELRSALSTKFVQIKLDGNNLAMSASPTFAPPASGSRNRGEEVFFQLADNATGTAKISLLIDGEVVYTREVDLTPFTEPSYEVPSRSIEDFAAVERNGELALYALVGDAGLSRGASGAALPVDEVMLAVGNGAEWPVNERLLRTSRSTSWLNSGATAFGAGRIPPNSYGYFTVIGSDGTEALGATLGINSLRLSTSAKNPVWHPTKERGADAPLWRGNAFFDLNGSKMIVGLQKPPGGKTFARALASPIETRWVDFGALPLPGLNDANVWLTSFTDGGKFGLIAGPHVQLFTSESTLRDWKETSLRAPETWEKMQALRWDDRLWLFGITRRNGRGVITWRPLQEVGGAYETVNDFKFVPPALKKMATQPAPGIPLPIGRLRENETNVR